MTTPVPTRKLLKEYLEDLNDERLKEFHWQLWQIKIDGSQPIPKSKLPKNSTREETVDKLVEVFGEDGAVKRTVETLREIKHYDLASKLKQAKEDQSLEQKEEEPETSSAREEPREVDPTVPEDLSFFADPVVLQFGQFCWSYAQNDCERKILWEGLFPKQCVPEADTISEYIDDIEPFQTPPKNIREKQEDRKKVKQLADLSIELIKTQSYFEEMQITDDFNKRRALLDEEEKTSRAALRKQTRQKISWIADTTKKILLYFDTDGEIGTFRADKIFIQVCTVLMLCALVVGIGWTCPTFRTTATFAEASGKPPCHCLGENVEQHEKERK